MYYTDNTCCFKLRYIIFRLGDVLVAVTFDGEFGNIKLTDKLLDHRQF